MKIAIIGMGNVGSVLGRRWASAGHEVVFGVRNPDARRASDGASGIRLATIGDAVAAAEVVTLAVPWPAVEDALEAAGDLRGKVLLDCTNPLSPGLSGLALGTTTSGGEEVARLAAGARVVKVFNTTGAANMQDPDYGGVRATMFVAGDDADAKRVACELAGALGFEPCDVGGLTMARTLEPLALLWITLAVHRGWGPDFALQLVRRPGSAASG